MRLIGKRQILDIDPRPPALAGLGGDVRGGAIMHHAPDPGAHRAAGIEAGEALPKRDLQLLEKVALQFGIGFIAARHAGDSAAEAVDRLFEQPVLRLSGHPDLPKARANIRLVAGGACF